LDKKEFGMLNFSLVFSDNLLEEAIGSGELITIIYQGGSRPSSSRMISPIKVDGDKVRARCFTTNAIKDYSIHKITIVNNPDGVTNYAETQPNPEPISLIAAITPYLDELKTLGWHIELTDTSIELYDFFKNGKRRKTPSLQLCFCEFTTHVIYDFEADGHQKQIEDKSGRPWHTSGSTFKSLAHATEKFMNHARSECTVIKNKSTPPAP
jgi:hypothetical protein